MLDQVREQTYDLVVMDISMPGRSGPEVPEGTQAAGAHVAGFDSEHASRRSVCHRMFKAGAADISRDAKVRRKS